jgi:hypothetical protein
MGSDIGEAAASPAMDAPPHAESHASARPIKNT